MTRQPVCRGQSRSASSRNLAASSGECLSVVDAVRCVRDALWKMMCASMSWCPGCLVVCSCFFHVGFYHVFFPPQTGPSPYISQVIIFLIFSPPPPAKLRLKILDASSLFNDLKRVAPGLTNYSPKPSCSWNPGRVGSEICISVSA